MNASWRNPSKTVWFNFVDDVATVSVSGPGGWDIREVGRREVPTGKKGVQHIRDNVFLAVTGSAVQRMSFVEWVTGECSPEMAERVAEEDER